MNQDSVKMSDLERSKHAREVMKKKLLEREGLKNSDSQDWGETNLIDNEENITQETQIDSESKLKTIATKENPQEVSTQQSNSLKAVVLPSMNLINDSAKQLKDLMSSRIEENDSQSVVDAVNCAKGIADLIRAQTTVLAEVREWKKK